jgi:hypothetical protein
MKDPKSLSFALGVMDDMFIKLDLQDFHTHTVHELLWGYKDTALTKAHSILIGLAKSRDPAFNIELPEKFALQVSFTRNFELGCLNNFPYTTRTELMVVLVTDRTVMKV